MLYERNGSTATATGRLERGNSRLVESLAAPGESYAEVLDAIETRTEQFEESVAVKMRGNEPHTDEVQP